MSVQVLLWQEIAKQAEFLPLVDKVELLEWLGKRIKQELIPPKPAPPRTSLYGLWADLGISISSEDITEARREMLNYGR